MQYLFYIYYCNVLDLALGAQASGPIGRGKAHWGKGEQWMPHACLNAIAEMGGKKVLPFLGHVPDNTKPDKGILLTMNVRLRAVSGVEDLHSEEDCLHESEEADMSDGMGEDSDSENEDENGDEKMSMALEEVYNERGDSEDDSDYDYEEETSERRGKPEDVEGASEDQGMSDAMEVDEAQGSGNVEEINERMDEVSLEDIRHARQ